MLRTGGKVRLAQMQLGRKCRAHEAQCFHVVITGGNTLVSYTVQPEGEKSNQDPPTSQQMFSEQVTTYRLQNHCKMSKYGDSKDVWDRTYGQGTEHDSGIPSLQSLSFDSHQFILTKKKERGGIKLSDTLLLQRLVKNLSLQQKKKTWQRSKGMVQGT